ncbi:hypothetical protein ACTJJ0_10835 [Chitinophaga sp. 22321]|uniref:DUF3575 domain-containing protein n=1 Tax=Chitinophaga hostae TaxID=2831022 RepID=A0ABS5IUM5_9BACT|nr:hypothetical protein [Chitinophaga hostae]MBS0026042.1 hypothetical protein [Chitinophaga hostae]
MHVLSALLLAAFLHVNAQDELARKPSQLKANVSLLGLNANYELRLLKYATLNLEAGIDMGLAYSYSDYMGSRWAYAMLPDFSGEARQYYGIARREARGKRIDNNAGNFFSVAVGYRTLPIVAKDYYESAYGYIIPAWGMQRSWGKHFSFEGRFGWMFSPRSYNTGAVNALVARLQVGYVIW